MTKLPPGGKNVNMSDWLTIKVWNSHQLENGNNDQRVRGCKRVHQLQHVHPVLFNTQKIPEMSRSFTFSSAPLCFWVGFDCFKGPKSLFCLQDVSSESVRNIFDSKVDESFLHTSVIIGNPRMKKEMQQARVKSGLCFLKYLGNSSETEVTMVSMVANWRKRRR